MSKMYLICKISWEDLFYGSYLPDSLKLFSNWKKANKYLKKKLKYDSELWRLEVFKI